MDGRTWWNQYNNITRKNIYILTPISRVKKPESSLQYIIVEQLKVYSLLDIIVFSIFPKSKFFKVILDFWLDKKKHLNLVRNLLPYHSNHIKIQIYSTFCTKYLWSSANQLHYCPWQPFWITDQYQVHKFLFYLPKEHSCNVSLHLPQ